VARLRRFWEEGVLDSGWPLWPWWGEAGRQMESWAGIFNARLFGRPRLFRPRPPDAHHMAIYGFEPLAARLGELVDFDLLNAGEPRFSVVSTEVDTGRRIEFDTHRGQRVSRAHLLASCGFLPEFPAVELDGMLLGDGGLVANAPVESTLREEGERDLLCFIVELFSPEGARPRNLDQALGRRWDLLLGNQTRQTLLALAREHALRCALAASEGHGRWPSVTVLHLRYRAPEQAPAGDKMFDFSRAALRERWEAGYADMTRAARLALGSIDAARGSSSVTRSFWPGYPAQGRRRDASLASWPFGR